MRSTAARRSRHLYITAHDGERVIGSRTVRCAGDRGTEILRLTYEPGSLAVWGSTYNKVRQRSDLAQADLAVIVDLHAHYAMHLVPRDQGTPSS